MMKFVLYFLLVIWSSVVFSQGYLIEQVSLNSAGSAKMCPVKYGNDFVYMSNDKSEYIRTVKDGSGNYPFNFHLAKRDSLGNVKKTVSFAPELTTLFNDGPLTFFKRDSATILSRNQNIEKIGRRNQIQKLGLFISFYGTEGWSSPEPMPFNSEDYNCTHPAMNVEGTELIFASDQPGGYGGMDLYSSNYKSGSWSTPKNLGPIVNSEGNEVFPFLRNNTLFFSTDGQTTDRGLDIFKVSRSQVDWGNLSSLDSVINSSADDFGFSSFDNGQQYYFTSNRDKGKDLIYSYSNKYPEPDTCSQNKEIFYCFLLEDYNSLDESGMPLKFQWELGDGTTLDGYKVIHCYDTVGIYHAQLNVVDTVFNESYKGITEVEVEVKAEDIPYIVAPDTISLNSKFEAQINLSYYSKKPKLIYWRLNNTFVAEGKSVELISTRDDSLILSMVWQLPSGTTYCINKTIFIKDKLVDRSSNFEIFRDIEKEDLPLINSEVSVENVQVEDLYDYSVGTSKRMDDLYHLYTEMKELKFDSKIIEYQIEKKGKIEVDSDVLDILFALSSSSITEYNKQNLKQFTAKLTSKTELKIVTFSDLNEDVEGNELLSEQRAQNVKNELIKLGIARESISVIKMEEISEDNSKLKLLRKVEVSIIN